MVTMKEIVAPRGEQPAMSPTATEIAAAARCCAVRRRSSSMNSPPCRRPPRSSPSRRHGSLLSNSPPCSRSLELVVSEQPMSPRCICPGKATMPCMHQVKSYSCTSLEATRLDQREMWCLLILDVHR
ncbi:hypothetical protein PVAP13_6NG014772 [Panicum virgatum]|uniref:Uncharacterized protein n=1 Tax=Panicum virgatum TaxID=38727 RepID=A0A8T0QT80_PANVG|nr:hypothetical protein PVAP13_6NG014772 [Panicum virgatum]